LKFEEEQRITPTIYEEVRKQIEEEHMALSEILKRKRELWIHKLKVSDEFMSKRFGRNCSYIEVESTKDLIETIASKLIKKQLTTKFWNNCDDEEDKIRTYLNEIKEEGDTTETLIQKAKDLMLFFNI